MSKAISKTPVRLSLVEKQQLRMEAEEKSDKLKLKRLDKSDPEYKRVKGKREALSHLAKVFRKFAKANREK